MGRLALEVADIFRSHGPAWRDAQHDHLSLGQLKVMSAIEQCRTATLGGHVLHCPACEHDEVAYNSCRNRHCPKCQASAAKRWLEARQADLLPVEYYHVVFTLPAPISAIAYTNKAVIYNLLFEIAAETLRTIAADPKHLGAQIGATLVLHTIRIKLSATSLCQILANTNWLKSAKLSKYATCRAINCHVVRRFRFCLSSLFKLDNIRLSRLPNCLSRKAFKSRPPRMSHWLALQKDSSRCSGLRLERKPTLTSVAPPG